MRETGIPFGTLHTNAETSNKIGPADSVAPRRSEYAGGILGVWTAFPIYLDMKCFLISYLGGAGFGIVRTLICSNCITL